ncbi:hypothetical protein AJ79_03826 [Helicocarpus griseus UAMH5409]|uniref:DUF6536 domain-containing protein n=1 Tax=Helicocarpus griseus UAMH5409 TaxID=1447875 RepID=A0A2B7XVY9_9EURO|nr:hypothetical protein AJ79_03826 [Helicocarpus griseus UAMH5409]
MAPAPSIELQLLSSNDKPPNSSQSASNSKLPLLWKKSALENWKKTLYLGSVTSAVVLLFNVGFVLWAVNHEGLQDGRGVVFSGECKKSKAISIGFHLVINILGTMLLAASNYGMQCLCAPTRGDIDFAHSRGKWMDIGVQSIGNLWRIPRRKSFLWTCLAISSLPLHLVYNSTVFQTLSIYGYQRFVGNKPFSDFNGTDVVSLLGGNSLDPTFKRLMEKGKMGELEYLDNRQCVTTYSVGFQINHANLLIVSDDFNSTVADFANITSPLDPPISDPYDWMCAESRRISPTRSCRSLAGQVYVYSDNWTIDNPYYPFNEFRVKHCLSEPVPESCTVEYSIPLLLVVIVANIIKVAILWGVAFTMTDAPILTIGDAISSFVQVPDCTTRGQCLLSRDIVKNPVKNSKFNIKPRRWGSPVSGGPWTICLLSYFGSERKGLRVSTRPRGSQRSGYFLSLPYRYSIPFLTSSAVLHWLISLSFYLVNIKRHGSSSTLNPKFDGSTCGYSPVAIVATTVFGVSMIVVLVLLALFKRFKSGMPVAGSCSLAIAAACHPPSREEEGDIIITTEETGGVDVTLPLKWGVCKDKSGGVVPHCAFSSEEVEDPQDGIVYK